MESKEERFERLQTVLNKIINHSPEQSFSELIDGARSMFKGFKLIYSTNNLKDSFAKYSLETIEKECPVLKKYFYGTGLLFYSDQIYDKTKEHKRVEFPIDYSLSLDSNAAEYFRCWENGKNLDTNTDNFEKLVRLIKEGEGNGFNFDYSFFIIENYFDSLKTDNHRPFNTVRALKRFDHLIYEADTFDVNRPQFNESQESAGKRAIETLYAFHSSDELMKFQERRMFLYLILLKALILRQDKATTVQEKISELTSYCIDKLGKFAKTELYFAWKLIKYGDKLKFFDAVSQISPKTLRKVKGMSWDIFALRYQETLASKGDKGEFFIPFFASFDKRFIELAQACPIRAVLLDELNGNVITIQLDELEFQNDLSSSITKDVSRKLMSTKLKLNRIKTRLVYDELLKKSKLLEEELEKYC